MTGRVDAQFTELYERTHDKVARYCLRRLPPDEARDALTDTFLAASFGALLTRFTSEEEKAILPEMASTLSRQPLRAASLPTPSSTREGHRSQGSSPCH